MERFVLSLQRGARPCCPFPALRPPQGRELKEYGVFTRKRTLGMHVTVDERRVLVDLWQQTGAESITFRLERYIPVSMEIAVTERNTC